MKQLFLLSLFACTTLLTQGQETRSETEKSRYAFEEIITVTFGVDSTLDSMQEPDFVGFRQLGGASKSYSMSMESGIKKETQSYSFRLRPTASGQMTLPSPIYFMGGKEVHGKSVSVFVEASTLTQEELDQRDIQAFIEDPLKPDGTLRFNVFENKGYVEKFGASGWLFYRTMTPEEIMAMPKLN